MDGIHRKRSKKNSAFFSRYYYLPNILLKVRVVGVDRKVGGGGNTFYECTRHDVCVWGGGGAICF